jgi:MYXO-CTERM domain-containing protein
VVVFAGSSIDLPIASTLRSTSPVPVATTVAPAVVRPRTGAVGGIPSTSAVSGGGAPVALAGLLLAVLGRRRRPSVRQGTALV